MIAPRVLLAGLAALIATPLLAQPVVTSEGPQAVEVSLYRDSTRSPSNAINRDWPEGFALISEIRTVTLPAGPATIRFEGVASGINPASALVRGVGVEEKNQDANLLSQRGLLDNFTGQSVTVRRFNPATGQYTEEPAIIRSHADRLILQTSEGFEPLYCTGLDQTLVFDRLPEDLSAKPTLSVAVADQPGGRYEIRLTYLAERFDWQANYVAELNDDATAIDLRGWMTMVSADATSFVDADTNAVAGNVYRDASENTLYADGMEEIAYNCWPYGTTGAFGGYDSVARLYAPPPPPPPAIMARRMAPEADIMESASPVIVVTGARIASREDLGDLKLYRIPFRTTVATNSQKQVAFLDKQDVEGELVYVAEIEGAGLNGLRRIFRIQNEKRDGLGEPLPSGQFAFFQRALGLRQLVGEDAMSDKAVGEEIELELGGADNVTVEIGYGDTSGRNWEEVVVTVRNANPVPITIETELVPDMGGDTKIRRISRSTFERDGRQVWRAAVPANDEIELRYREYETDKD